MAEKLGDAILELRTDSRQYDAGIKKAEKGAKGLETNLKRTGLAAVALKTKLIGIGAALVGVGFAVNRAFSFAEQGVKLNAQRKAFENLAKTYGTSGKDIVDALKRVSNQAVDTASLVDSATKAMLLGIDPSKFEKLMEIARAASKATGDTITKSFEDITIGIGRQSKLILDNLGIIVKVKEANQRYAKQLGIVTSELTDVQKKQAFLNETLRAGQAIIDGVGNSVVDMADKWARLRVIIKETVDSIKLAMADWLETHQHVIEGMATHINNLINKLKIATGAMRDLQKESKKNARTITGAEAVRRFGTAGFSDTFKEGGFGFGLVQEARLRNLKIKEDAQEAEGALVELDTEIKSKAVDLEAMGDAGKKAFDTMQTAITGWASNFSLQLTEILFKSGQTFGSIAEQFAKMITQMFIQTQFVDPLIGLFTNFTRPRLPVQTGTPGEIFGIAKPKLNFDSGGIVPGPTGMPVPAIVHGGETITPPGSGNVEINIIGAPENTRVNETESVGSGRRFDIILDEEVSNVIKMGSRTQRALSKTFNLSSKLQGR